MLNRIILFIFINTSLFASPNWFYNIAHKNYEIVAYGIDKELTVARDIAKSEISKQISIQITSNTNINKLVVNGNYNKSIQNEISTSTNATLQGIKILKEIQKDNLWYVSVIYDNRTLLQKIKAQINNIKPSKIQNSYIYNTPLIKDIFNTLGYKTNIKLIRKDNSWYLNISDNLFLLNTNNFIELFVNIENKDIKISANKKIYKYPDTIQFKITSKQKGYVSILYSEESGKVGIILDNAKIDKQITYPKDNAEHQLIAYNPTKNTLTELYICIYSKIKIDLSLFEQVSDDLLDGSNYNFDKILGIIKNKEFSTIKLKIRGK